MRCRPGEPERASAMVALAFIVLAGTALRLLMAVRAFCSTFDTATVGLMAVNILKHGERPLFFYGQSYFGSIEAFTAALLFRLFGISELVLSAAPILYSAGWIAMTYLLFTEWSDRRAGLAAAAVTAVPGFVTLRYCVGTDGGYPTAFMLGTAALWLCLRIQRRDLQGRALLIHTLPLGAAAGLAFWTHPLSVTYLLPGALLILAHLIRRRFDRNIIVPMLWALPVFLLCIAPLFSSADLTGTGSSGLAFSLTAQTLWEHFTGMFRRPIRQHLFTHWETPWVWWPVRILFLMTCLAYLAGWRSAVRPARARLAYPLMFAVVFTALYVVNPMAQAMTPRYVIPMWLVLLGGMTGAAVSAPPRAVRIAGWTLLSAWTLFYGISNILYIREQAPRRDHLMADRTWVVDTARGAGLRSVFGAGSAIYGHHGQIYCFTSHGDIAFVSPFDERYQPNALLAEQDDAAGIMIGRRAGPLVANALNDLDAVFRITNGASTALFHDITALPLSGAFVPGTQITGSPVEVSDRRMDTAVTGRYEAKDRLIFRLDRPRMIDAVLIAAPDITGRSLPRRVWIEGSLDGETFFTLRPPIDRVTVLYTAGNRVWVKGYEPHFECRFEPSPVTAVRITPMEPQYRDDPAWEFAEVFLHEPVSPPAAVTAEEIERVVAICREQDAAFVFADRWMSARLREGIGPEKVLPRYNTKFPETMADRSIVPAAGIVVAVAAPFADETERVIRRYAAAAPYERTDTGAYSVFVFTGKQNSAGESPALRWFGSFLTGLKTGADTAD